ncbi:MAG: hypothetical protein JNN24_01765 [Hyphomicrobium zavarzinii]|jgi:hypothetical protein|uniref:hypothetical protein n=1 Tax=Hyphomicrobium TaxID=81 RepID=UPI0003A6E5C3|nr:MULTISPECIES: hypothetical protein [Hyphomicrobium]MBL8844473.1 hypothetical protein [Hyphomicrobium zavarzinii]WBT38718.1 hypothetical protein PE058_02255 [Hyphomicrobium sp. DMF-1]
MAGGDAQSFGSCCEELKEAMSGEEFEPLITVGDDGVLYMSVGLVELEDEEPGMVDHPIFFCPFCGKGVQTPDEVRAKAGDDEDDDA